eukprot:515454-Rhodomonas_salina.1
MKTRDTKIAGYSKQPLTSIKHAGRVWWHVAEQPWLFAGSSVLQSEDRVAVASAHVVGNQRRHAHIALQEREEEAAEEEEEEDGGWRTMEKRAWAGGRRGSGD